MRLRNGDAAVFALGLTLMGCGAVDALSPQERSIPGPVPIIMDPALASLDEDRFYVAAGDSMPRIRVRALDSRGRGLSGVYVAFGDRGPDEARELGIGITDSAGILAAPRVPAVGVTGRRTLVAAAPGLREADFPFLVLPAAYAGPSQRACPIPPSLLPLHPQLTRTLAVLRGSDSLRIVAIGSSSTAGVGATSPSAAYPARLESRLRAAYPANKVVVWNKGVSGQLATDMLARFDRDVVASRPHLVIWQTGTIEAVSAAPVDAFEATLRQGIAQLRAAGADVLLLDSQAYAGKGQEEPYLAFQRVLWRVGADLGVPVVTRYQLMAHYQATGRYTWAQLLSSDSFHPSDLTYDCTAHLVLAGLMAAQVDPGTTP